MLYGRRLGWKSAIPLLVVLLMTTGTAFAQEDHPADQPLRVGADVGYAPFHFRLPSGEVVGFSVDVLAELARRLGRPGYEIIDVNYSAIFSGMFAKRYEFVISPANITMERAQQMLFTEGYMSTGLGLLIPASAPDLTSLEDLRGKVIGVNNGSNSDNWATANQARYGFEIQRYDKDEDALQALIIGRVDANMTEAPRARYMTTLHPMVKFGYEIDTGASFGFPFRPDDKEFRDLIERIVEGMKLDGTLVAIHEKWFGGPPGPDSSMSKVWAGYGHPGFPGYVFEPHEPYFP